MWALFLQSRGTNLPPSSIFGLTAGSYEAYCFDQAIWYFGSTIEAEMEKASMPKRRGKGSSDDTELKRRQVLNKYMKGPDAPGQYADPAAFFKGF